MHSLSHRRRARLRALGIMVAVSTAAGALYGAGLEIAGDAGPAWLNIAQGAMSGFLISLLVGGTDYFLLSDPRNLRIRALPFVAFVALRTAVYGLGSFIGLRAPSAILRGPESLAAWNFTDPLFVRIFAISVGIAFLIALTIEISRLLGPGVLPALITGRYHLPRKEDRVFLFADLEGSTALAERIGDLEFHRFLSAVWADCAEPIRAFRGETYRYVGDEIIVTWPLARGVEQARCLHCALAMEERLDARGPWYLREFGAAPRFRAALHCGPVVTGEMGDQRKEIVFLGDTVNTASRLQGECRARGVELLLSGRLADLLPPDPGFALDPLGEWLPRGKTRPIRVTAARRV